MIIHIHYRRFAGIFLIVEGLLAFVPLLILGPAIGWPDSLDAPAAKQLASIAAEADAVRFGYSIYLLYSLLIMPAMAVVARYALPGQDAGSRTLLTSVIALAAASALARCIGILRWLTVMPLLALQHQAVYGPQLDQIELIFSALSEYGGGIGELLGVSVFMSLAVFAVALPAWRRRSMPRWLSGFGVLAALALAALLLPALGGPDAVPIAVAATSISLWHAAAGMWLLFSSVPEN
jgi:Domain of unknown function (DUF4386)